MESFFKASVIFLLTFSFPSKTHEPSEKTHEPLYSAATQHSNEPAEEKSNFWLGGIPLLAE